MRTHCFRLHRGDDLRGAMEDYVRAHHIRAAVVLSAVGCVSRARLRDASGVNIRTLEEHGGVRKIDEGRDVEFVGVINYSLIYLIQHSGFPGIPSAEEVLRDLSVLDRIRTQDILDAYQKAAAQVKELLLKKNFDYGDAWKSMEPCSLTDQVVVRVCRVKSLLAKGGAKVSDGVDAQLMDIINFSVFALIRMDSPLFGI